MTLKLTLKPGESVFIGTTRMTVDSRSTCIVYIDGDAPILRANEMLDPAGSDQPLQRFRYVLQEMYLKNDFVTLIGDYFDAAAALVTSRPDAREGVARANQLLATGALYEALKVGKQMAQSEVIELSQRRAG